MRITDETLKDIKPTGLFAWPVPDLVEDLQEARAQVHGLMDQIVEERRDAEQAISDARHNRNEEQNRALARVRELEALVGVAK